MPVGEWATKTRREFGCLKSELSHSGALFGRRISLLSGVKGCMIIKAGDNMEFPV